MKENCNDKVVCPPMSNANLKIIVPNLKKKKEKKKWQILNWMWSEVKWLSHVQLFATPWTVPYQAPSSIEFFRQEYWSGLPFPSPRNLLNPGIEPRSPALQANALLSIREAWWIESSSLYFWQNIPFSDTHTHTHKTKNHQV